MTDFSTCRTVITVYIHDSRSHGHPSDFSSLRYPHKFPPDFSACESGRPTSTQQPMTDLQKGTSAFLEQRKLRKQPNHLGLRILLPFLPTRLISLDRERSLYLELIYIGN
jgi:hypothetical protein